MKKIFYLLTLIALLFSCEKNNDSVSAQVTQSPNIRVFKKCATDDVFKRQMSENPSLAKHMQDIENFTQNMNKFPSRRLVNGKIEIPVVVNVLYNTTAQNISLTQIQSQIAVLNKDYSATNTDYSLTPSTFQSVRSGDITVSFVLDTVFRKYTTTTSWSTNDYMKKSTKGGINPTSPTTKLNIWVCNLGGGILGYAQFPGGSSFTDGVVIDDNAFGSTGTVISPYDKGRTATHEIGHWMNLRHIWGDKNCGNDYVSDTPIHTNANYGCPSFPSNSSCGGTIHPMMTMNYMDYTDDACMYMFTLGQKSRMLAVFATGGPRNTFAQP